MLNSLEIINFRNLRDLRLTSLKRINLFTGKNNTGKSTILDALFLYAMNVDVNYIYQLLDERGENYRGADNKSTVDLNIKALSSLFTNRIIGFDKSNTLCIGAMESTLFGETISNEKFVSLRLVRYYDEISDGISQFGEVSGGSRRRIIIENEKDSLNFDFEYGLELRSGSSSYILPLNRDRPYRILGRSVGTQDTCEYIHTRNIDKETNSKLWDNITLSEKENYVIDALKIIEPNVERIAFIDENRKERTAIIKIKGNNNVLPLKSMGDGINRILTIILGLVNSENGYLLIDEFENGLHYSVQEKLWEIIFALSHRLNVQIFATTHSEDCISSFQSILNFDNNYTDGKLIRLDLKSGEVSQVEFDSNDLKIATQQNIETR